MAARPFYLGLLLLSLIVIGIIWLVLFPDSSLEASVLTGICFYLSAHTAMTYYLLRAKKDDEKGQAFIRIFLASIFSKNVILIFGIAVLYLKYRELLLAIGLHIVWIYVVYLIYETWGLLSMKKSRI